MLSWWLYTIALSVIVSAAAWTIERLAWSRDRSSRAAWMFALAGSAVWSLLVGLNPGAAMPLATGGLPIEPPPSLRDAVLAIYRLLPSLDGWLPGIWLAASISLVATGWASHRYLVVAARRCETRKVSSVSVWVSPCEGPAVFGVLRPRILLPSWLMAARPAERRLALVHELSHVRAGDVPLVWTAYLFVCAMPWNPAAWWMFRRLREAVEIDCDRRVLARRSRRRIYGELLVRTAMARSPALAIAPGLLARRSSLRRRIERLSRRDRTSGPLSWALLIPAAGSLAVAALLPPPLLSGWVHRLDEVRVTGSPDADAPAESGGGVYRATEIPAWRAAPHPAAATDRARSELEGNVQARFEAGGTFTIREHSTPGGAGASGSATLRELPEEGRATVRFRGGGSQR
jgi:hypothetical protein